VLALCVVTRNFPVMTILPDFWLQSDGADLLARTATLLDRFKGDTLRTVTRLRTEVPNLPQHIYSRTIECALARIKARPYGEWTRHGFFTRQSVEQATSPAIAHHHASRFAGCRFVLEICTGAGFDTAALAARAERVLSIEADPEVAAMARHNIAVQNINNVEVVCGRAEEIIPTLDIRDVDALWADPSRRIDGQRADEPELYAPPLSFVVGLAEERRCGIKIAPAATPEPHAGAAHEWIGYGSECREQILWFNAPVIDNTVSLVDQKAIFLPVADVSREEIVSRRSPGELSGLYLVEPHNALVRSGVLHSLYAEDCIELLDPHIAYGISILPPSPSPFYTRFHILEAFPWNEKLLKTRLRERGWSNGTEIKKRGFPQLPEQVRAKLKLPSKGTSGVVILTRVGEGHLVLLAERM
jgi:SAM-dependent methyltransferase